MGKEILLLPRYLILKQLRKFLESKFTSLMFGKLNLVLSIFFLSNPDRNKPEITITHCSIFDFDFKSISKQYHFEKLLIIGNPPWVTNSKLGSLNSSNLPKKNQISRIKTV